MWNHEKNYNIYYFNRALLHFPHNKLFPQDFIFQYECKRAINHQSRHIHMTTTHLLYVVYDIYKPEAIYVASYIYILVAILSVFVSLVLRSFSHVSENLVLHTDKIIYSFKNIMSMDKTSLSFYSYFHKYTFLLQNSR